METLNENDIRILNIIRRNPGLSKSTLATKAQMPWSTAYASISKLGSFICSASANSAAAQNFGANTSKYKAGIYINGDYEYYVGVSVGSSQIKLIEDNK